jgi:hypothetical protein
MGILAALRLVSAADFEIDHRRAVWAAAAQRRAQRDADLRKMDEEFSRRQEALRKNSPAHAGDEQKTGSPGSP